MKSRIRLALSILLCLQAWSLVALPTWEVTSASNGGTGSFRTLVGGSSPGDTITFSPALIGDTIDISSSSIAILHDLTIIGPGADQLAFTSSNDLRRILLVFAGNVSISGLSFANSELLVDAALVDRGGAAIAAQSPANLVLSDCVFRGNRSVATDPSVNVEGGAVHAQGPLTMTDCRFFDNEARHGGGSAFGGAVFGAQASMTLTRCTLMANTAESASADAAGGALYTADLTASAHLEDCLVQGNRVFNSNGGAFGGGLACYGDLTVLRSTIAKNLVRTPEGFARCGAIFYYGNNTVIDRSTISGNIVRSSGGAGMRGAAIGSGGSTVVNSLTITNSTIVLNQLQPGTGTSNSPVIYNCCRTAGSPVDPSIITNTLFAWNYNDGVLAGGSGSVSFSWDELTSGGYNFKQIAQSRFPNVTGDLSGSTAAPLDPGIDTVLRDNGGLTPTHALSCTSPGIDAGNPSDLSPDQAGQSVFGGRRDIGALEDQGNGPLSFVVTSTADSGPGSLRETVALACPGSTISFDPAIHGDSIVFGSTIPLDKDLTLVGPGPEQMTLSGSGSQRLFAVASGAHVEIRGLRIRRGNSAILNDGELTVRDCLFDRNVTGQVGGAIRDENILRVYDSEFRGNAITGSTSTFDGGGAIYSELDSLVLVRCTFRNNSAADPSGGPVRGGAVWAASASSGVRIDNCLFEGNEVLLSGSSWFPAAYYGGGALFSNAMLRVSNTEFSENQVSGNGLFGGGAAMVYGQSSFEDCAFSRNTAVGNSAQAGALFGESTANYSLDLTRCHFASNEAISSGFSFGGAIAFNSLSSDPQANLTATDTRFTNNAAGRTGGAMYVERSDFSLLRCTLDSNTAGDATLTSSSTQGGGALYFNGGLGGGTGSVDRCTFSGNVGVNYGGAILYANTSNLTVNRSTLTRNRAVPSVATPNSRGGAVYLFCGGASLSVANTILSDNEAVSDADVWVPSGCSASAVSNGYNLWGAVGGALSPVGTDNPGITDPQLAPLGVHGGLLPTHAPLCESAVLNAGDPSDVVPDQSGQSVVGAARDIGAYEAGIFPVEGFQAGNMSSPLEFDWSPYCNPDRIDGYRLFRRSESSAFLDIPNPLTLQGQDPAAGTFLHPGFFETYRIVALSGTDVSEERKSLGRVRPNGRIQGNVRTKSGGPISGVQICALPTANKGLSLDGVDDYVRAERALPLGPKGSLSVFLHADDWTASVARGIAGNDLPATANGAVGLDYDAATGLRFRYGGSGQAGSRVLTWTDTATVAGWHHVAATWATDAGVTRLALYWDGRPVAETTTTLSLAGSAHWNVGRNGDGQYWEGRLDEFQVRSDAIDSVWAADSAGIIPEASLLEKLELYWRFETEAQTAGSVLAVDYAKDGLNHVALQNGASLSVDNGYPMRYCAETGTGPNAGKFTIDEVFYAKGAGSSFTVFPVSEDRFYDPAEETASLDVGDPTQSGVDFTDTTSFSVEGTISLAGNSSIPVDCKLDSVRVLISGPVPIFPNFVYTDFDGKYSAAVPEEGNWTFTPQSEGRYDGHGFVPPSRSYLVDDDVILADFEDTTRQRLVGSFRGGCELTPPGVFPINRNIFTDKVTIRVKAKGTIPDGCIQFDTALAGNDWNLRLPPFEYDVEIVAAFVDGIPDTDIRNRLISTGRDRLTADLRQGADTTHFIYRAAPVLTVETVGEELVNFAGCTLPTDTFRYLEQAVAYTVPMRAEEEYTYLGVLTTCPVEADSMVVDINDPIGGQSGLYALDTLGKLDFPLVPVNINSLPGSTPPPYSLGFSAKAIVDGEFSPLYATRYVVGGFRADSNSAVALGPPMVSLVLRDPPGDNSFTEYLRDTTVCFELTMDTSETRSTSAYGAIQIGTEFSTGIGMETNSNVWATVSGDYVQSQFNTSSTTSTQCVSYGTEWRTSADPEFVGPDADLFIGSTWLFRYSASERVLYDPDSCRLVQTRSLAVAPSAIASQFTVPRSQIINQVIPDLENLAAQEPLEPDGTLNEFAQRRLNNANAWRQWLTLTEQAVDYWMDDCVPIWDTSVIPHVWRPCPPVENYTVGGGGTFKQSRGSLYGLTESITYDMYWDAGIAAEAGFNLAGTGAYGGFTTNFGVGSLTDTTEARSGNTVVSFTISDNDPGDLISTDVVWAGHNKVPHFRVTGGQTSCPFEPGTVQRDNLTMTVDDNNVFVPSPLTAAEFTLTIADASTSTTDVSRSYKIQADNNLDNAIVTAFGGNLATPIPFTLDNDEEILVTLRVERPSDPSAYEYRDIRIVVFADCETIATPIAELTVSATFESPCAEPSIAAPIDGWFINALDDDELPIAITDYGLGLVDDIEFEYRRLPDGLWSTFHTVPETVLAGAGTFYDYLWNVSALTIDAEYQIRLQTNCATGFNYSDPVVGTIDRTSLQPIATVPPDGGTLTFGPIPSVTFNEDLFCGTVGSSNALANFNDDGSTIGLEDPICGGATVTLPLRTAITTPCEYENRWVTYSVNNLIDQFGNPIETYSWSFYVDRFADPALSLTGTGPSAEGGSDGSVDLSVSGGFPPYTFLWSNGAMSEDLSGLPAGTYAVTVTDSKCSFITDSVTIEDPSTVPPPANDLCTAADTLAPGSYAITTLGATGTDISSCGVSDTADVWFYYIPTRSGTAIVSTCGSDFDPVITVRPSCTGGTEFGCNDNDLAGLRCGGNEAAIELSVNAGVGAYIRLSGANGSVGHTTLTIEEPAIGCSSATPPQNPRHTVQASRVRLEWDPIAGSEACEVRGERLVPSPVNGKATINAPEASFTNVSFTSLGAGTTWRFRVRCACSITPTVDATGFSAYDTFSVPAARDVIDPQDLRAVNVFPNPARETLHVDLQGYADSDVDLRVIDASGRTVLARRLAVGSDWTVEPIDLSGLPAGAYSLTVTDRQGTRSLRFVHLE